MQTCGRLTRAVFDRSLSALGIVVLSPVFLAAAVAIAVDSGLPILFRQTRVGRSGVLFQVLKFRTMRAGVTGARITAAGDRRVTRTGRILRRFKVDELPQLWNVLKGDMSLVGPRPEVPAFVDPESAEWRAVLQVRPGITDVATLAHYDEEQLLAGSADPERYYRERVLPAKLRLNIDYMRARSFLLDLKLILLTVRQCLFPRARGPAAAQELLAKFSQ